MTDGGGTAITTATVLLVVCLCLATVAPPAMAGSMAISDVGSASGSDVESTTDSRDGAITPALRSASGSTEIVVRFEGDASLGPNEVGEPGASGGLSTDELKTDAANAQADFERFAERNPAVAIERQFWLANAMLVTVDTDRVPVDRLLDVQGVERVHENFEVELDSAATAETDAEVAGSIDSPPPGAVGSAGTTASVSTASTDATYGVEMVRAPEVWQEFDTRGEGATVAVLDTGADPDHPDLTVSGWAEIDANGEVIQDDDGPYDPNGHGTHVAGTVAGGNSSGTAIGVAPDATVHAIKVFPGDERSTTFTYVIGGMEAALDESVVGEPADVLQMSLGADGEYVPDLIEPVRNARSTGAIVVASSGNSGQGTSSSPANVYDSLAVGAVGETRGVAWFSSGENITTSEKWEGEVPDDWPVEYVVPDVSGPGVDVYSAAPGGAYTRKDGTSMAAPHVSGVAALMLSASTRNASDQELYETIRDTANHPENKTEADPEYGTGIVDAFAAVSSITENRSNLAVIDFDAPNETAPGATLETSATINNTGEDPGAGTVEYRFNDTVGDEANVSLQPGEETTVAFSYVVPPETETNRTYEHGVYTGDSNVTAEIDVLDTPYYRVTNLTTPDIAERDGPLNATANVTNRGVRGENRTVELRLTDPGNASNVSVLAATDVTLGAGNGTTVSLNGTVPNEFDTGEGTVTIASPDDAESRPVRIADAVGTIDGTVTDAETNAGLPDIDVTVENGSTVVGTATTGANGTYAVDVPATNLTVTATNETYAPATQTVELSTSGDTATANFSLALRDGTLSGVVGADDGLDLPANATVTVTNQTDDAVAAVDAADDGTYAVDLRPDTYNVTAVAPDFESEVITDLDIEANATTDGNFELTPLPATVSGTVTNESNSLPIEDAAVEIGSSSTTADADGNYAIDDLDRGDREVTVSADGYTERSQQVTLAANETRELDVSLSPRGVFTITDLSGSDEIEQGSNGAFDVTVRNDGRAADDAVVDVALSPSGSASPNPVAIDGVAVGNLGSESFTVDIDSGASTGTYTVTTSTGDDSRELSFEVVSGDDGGSDDGASGGGGGGGSGGGGGGAGGDGQTQPPADDTEDETEDEPTDETEDEPTDEPTDDIADDEELDDDTGEAEPDDDAPEDTGNGDSADNSRPDAEADDAQPDETTDDDAPGFGVAAGVIALLAGMLWTRRAKRSNER